MIANEIFSAIKPKEQINLVTYKQLNLDLISAAIVSFL